jgi:pimeloyl-ACP methyl ester carboxylesterase
MPTIRRNGLDIAFSVTGQGPPLVLLHGYVCDSRMWQPQLLGLADAFQLIAWDTPGTGSSSDPPDWYRMADYADCLDWFLDATGFPQAHIAGLSWGGVLALELYRRFPARVSSLVLADTYAGWPGSIGPRATQERLEANLRQSEMQASEFLPGMMDGLVGPSASEDLKARVFDLFSEFHPQGFRVMARAVAEADQRDILPRITVPTLLIWGEHDARSSLEIARQFHEAIPASKLLVIPGAGHMSNLESSEAFNSAVRGFCLPIDVPERGQ